MTLTQLTYLVAVDTYRHFARAATHCFVSQPTLSVQLQKLEDELGVQLFDRSRNPVVPTDIGKQVIEQARIALRESARIQEVVDEAGDALTGTLNLGILPTLATYIVPLIMPAFSEKYPGVRLVFFEMITTQVLAGLKNDTLDAGLIATEELDAGLHSQAVFKEPFVAYLSAHHRLADHRVVAAEDLSLDDLWLLKEGHCFRDQMLQVCGGDSQACGIHRSVSFESGNLETLQKLVDQAGGMTLLPYLATLYMDENRIEERVRPFIDPVPVREVHVVHRRAYLKKHLIRVFIDTLLEVLPAELLERIED